MGIVEEFFSDSKVLSYYLTHGPFPAEKELFKRFLKKKGKVLDLCGGAGRIALYLSKKGFEVVVADNNQRMIKEGRKKARELGLNVKFVEANAEDFHSEREFDYVLLMENSLEHIEDRDARERIVKVAHDSLVEEGLFFTSFHSRFYPFRWRSNHIIRVKKLMNIEVNKPLFFHFFSPFEIRNLLKRAGFKGLKVIPLNLLDKSKNRFKHELIYKLIWPLCYTFWIAEK
ncbi:MAG: class I SAM-dependent methyltransferase [Nanoarchaeota archaeon]|nr:class I SAM-dependent methyltransferase [Nanoarchaeota archaeon]